VKTLIIILFGAVTFFSGILVVYLAIEEDKHWQEFSTRHHCNAVGKIEPQTVPANASVENGGMVLAEIRGKTAYQCDDGKIYWKRD